MTEARCQWIIDDLLGLLDENGQPLDDLRFTIVNQWWGKKRQRIMQYIRRADALGCVECGKIEEA